MALAQLPDINPLTSRIIGAATQVHRILGPGLLESVYLTCLVYELRADGMRTETAKAIPVHYKGHVLDGGFRADLIVNETVIVEVKSAQAAAPVHRAQLVTYVKLAGLPAGLLINFNVTRLVDGVTRVLNTAR